MCMCVCVCVCVCVGTELCPKLGTLWTAAYHAPLSLKFSRQEYWNGLPFVSPGILPNPVIEPMSPLSPALAGRFFATESAGKPEGFLVVA